ncbi:MAG: glycoside hydrolase family 97 N-terminal domain-containing protein, partial [Clostridia bacterium]|nr:glycoside hydrolase family 97 N-terminal domain-containing protein [Clostridia bacterium]
MKIRHIILTALFIFGTAVTAHAAETVTSPDGNITLTLSADSGQITYDVTSGGQTVMKGSRLGITFESMDFSEGVTLVSRQDSEINETYPMISGKAAVYTNHANEAVFTFEKYGDTMDLYARVYNDGVAFRYGYGRDTRALG